MRYLALSMIFATSFAPDRPAPRDPPKPMVMDFEQLQGTWTLVAQETENGKSDAEALKNHPKLIIKGHQFGWSSPDGGTFKLDPTKTPKTIDYLTGPDAAPKTVWQGIYEINGDTFRDCMAPPGRPRPRDFSTPPASGYRIEVLKRVP